MLQHLNIGVPEEGNKRKGHEKIFEEIKVENVPKMGRNIHPSTRKPESLKQDKPKVKHPKTHIN